MKKLNQVLLAVFVAALSSSALAANWAPSSSFDSDSDIIRTADGASCEQSLSTGKHMEFGAYEVDGSTGAYARVVVQIGKTRPRIDCTRMYNLEMDRMELEIAELRARILRMDTNDSSDLESQWK